MKSITILGPLLAVLGIFSSCLSRFLLYTAGKSPRRGSDSRHTRRSAAGFLPPIAGGLSWRAGWFCSSSALNKRHSGTCRKGDIHGGSEMTVAIAPLHDRVLVKRLEAVETAKAGIYHS